MNKLFAAACMIAAMTLLSVTSAFATPDGDDLIKMARSGVDEEVLLAYIKAAPDTFSLSADDIVTLKDLGVPSKVIAEALLHGHPADSAAMVAAREEVHAVTSDTAVAAQPAAAVDTNAQQQPSQELNSAATEAPPADDQNISFFYQALSPYGTWLNIDGNWCWQPNATTVSPDWEPYCRHGHWVYSDWGWCWQSDYSWGWAAFHYGRWFRNDTYGWCWQPDNVWGPAWVIWRQGDDYCGWAPMPPHCTVAGDGYYYNNVRVGDDFDFHLGARDFFFLPTRNFGDPHPWVHVAPQVRAEVLFRQTNIDRKAYGVQDNHFFNRGPAVEVIARASNRRITPITIVHDNIQPGQLIHRGIVRGNQLLIYKPALSSAAPRSPLVVKAALEKQVAAARPDKAAVAPDVWKRQQGVAAQVLNTQRAAAENATREQSSLRKAAQSEGNVQKKSEIQASAELQGMKAQQAQAHVTNITKWNQPAADKPLIIPQSRVYPEPTPRTGRRYRRRRARRSSPRPFGRCSSSGTRNNRYRDRLHRRSSSAARRRHRSSRNAAHQRRREGNGGDGKLTVCSKGGSTIRPCFFSHQTVSCLVGQ